MPPPLQVDNIFVFIRQVAPVPASGLFKTSATSWPLTFWPWKWCPNHVWCGLYAKFSLTRLLCSRVMPDVHDRQTSDKSIACWRRSIVVRMLVSAGKLSLSCARPLAGWVITLRLSRSLSVSQHGQLSHPSLRGR